MTTAPARWPSPPADVSAITHPTAALEANLEATVFAAVIDLRRTTRLHDGTRSAQQLAWTNEFDRLGMGGATEVSPSLAARLRDWGVAS